MNDINFSDSKWKYTDKQFCDEVTELSENQEFMKNPDNFPELQEIINRATGLEKDLCSTTKDCPNDNCKCYYSSTQTEQGYNNVFCGTEDSGYVVACPEKCCRDGVGCPEPKRGDVVAYNIENIPENIKEVVSDIEETIEDVVSSPRMSIVDWIVIIAVAFVLCIGLYFAFKRGKNPQPAEKIPVTGGFTAVGFPSSTK